MLYQFQVVPSMSTASAMQGYCVSVESSVKHALCLEQISADSLWLICEYIDVVDSGELPMNRPMYRQAVGALWEYLARYWRIAPLEGEKLAKKSWGAQTLWAILSQQAQDAEDMPALKRVA